MQAAPPITKLASSISVFDVVIWIAQTTAQVTRKFGGVFIMPVI
jgi:hypothetical protein